MPCVEKQNQMSWSGHLAVSKATCRLKDEVVPLKYVAPTAEVLWSLQADGFPIIHFWRLEQASYFTSFGQICGRTVEV